MQKKQGLKLLNKNAVNNIDSIGIVCVCEKSNYLVQISSNKRKCPRNPEPNNVVVTDILFKDDRKFKTDSVKFTIRNFRRSQRDKQESPK